MLKTIHKFFAIWNFDKEEKWLNEMAARGLALRSVGWCRYDFEECTPGEYKVCLELLERRCADETEQYIKFLEDTGIEHVGTMMRWAYFRKKTTEDFRLFSDNASRIKYLTRVIRFMLLFAILNLYNGLYDLYLYFQYRNPISFVCLMCFALFLILLFGIIKLSVKRKKLKREQELFDE